MAFLLALVFALVPTGAPSGPAVSPEAPSDSIHSIASTRYRYDWVSGREAWHRRTVSLETGLPVGVVVGEFVHRRRFGLREFGGTGHLWGPTWGDSYGHLHASYAPNALTTPRLSLGGEHYEVVGDWELSGWYEWRRYADTDVHVLGPQIGRYLNHWYLRLRTSFVERNGTWVVMQMAAARYHLDAADSFVEAQTGYGRNVELVAARPAGALRAVPAYFGTARVRHFFTPHVGASLSATYSDASFQRVGLSAGVLARW